MRNPVGNSEVGIHGRARCSQVVGWGDGSLMFRTGLELVAEGPEIRVFI